MSDHDTVGSATEFELRGSWSGILNQLFSSQALDVSTSKAVMQEVLSGRATPAQIASFVTLLRAKGETVEELTGLTQALLDSAVPVPQLTNSAHHLLLDTCGTGGDRSGTINVSTMAALVSAAGGAVVAKHGNRAASSLTGSADVLEALGVAIDLGPAGVSACIDACGVGFFLATRYHPGFRFVAPIRRELGVSTAFNFMGPLINPARVQRQVIGVSDPRVAELMMGVLRANGTTRAMVFYGHDGLDELTTTAASTIFDLRDGEVTCYDIDPTDLGLVAARAEDLKGGTPAQNAARVEAILGGEPHPQSDIVALNAAAALTIGGVHRSIHEALPVAQEILASGRAAEILARFVDESQRQKALELSSQELSQA